MRYAIISRGAILLRALPSRKVAESILSLYPEGKVIVDPRCVTR